MERQVVNGYKLARRVKKTPIPFYDSQEEYMQKNKGRKPQYLTIERFEKFVSNDFYHLQLKVRLNNRLLWIILGGLIIAALIDRLVG